MRLFSVTVFLGVVATTHLQATCLRHEIIQPGGYKRLITNLDLMGGDDLRKCDTDEFKEIEKYISHYTVHYQREYQNLKASLKETTDGKTIADLRFKIQDIKLRIVSLRSLSSLQILIQQARDANAVSKSIP
jgi:hypothetical protein